SDSAARVRRERTAVLGPLAERRPDLRRRGPREARLLMRLRGILARIAGCAILLLALPITAGAEIADFLDRPIAAVRFRVEGRQGGDQSLAGLVKTRQGEVLSMRDVRESVAHLASLGRYEGVVVHAEADGD